MEEQDKTESAKSQRELAREAALDQMFGKARKQPMGNMWGWKFSLIGLAFMLSVGGVIGYGLYTGQVDIDKEMKRKHVHPLLEPKDSLPKSIKE